MGLSLFKFVQWAPKDASFVHRFAFWPFKVVQGHPTKVVDFGTNRKRVYDFLLVGHCDYGPILHRFRDMVTLLAKNCLFLVHFPYPSLIRRPRSLCSPRNFALKLTVKKLESWGYPPVKTA